MDGKRKKQVLVCSEFLCSLPLRSLILPLRSNFSVPSFKEKEKGKYKGEDGSPVHLRMFFWSTRSARKEQTTGETQGTNKSA